jgi:hypothetical protein
MNVGHFGSSTVAAAIAGVFVGALSGAASAKPQEGECRVAPDQIRATSVLWGGATFNESCFFFSGPADLGRDDHLGSRAAYLRSGDLLSVSFDGAMFQGRVEGDRVRLVRVSEHEFDGTWKVAESIDATLGEGGECKVLDGTYAYEECDTGPKGLCPGPCRISARVSFVAAR